MSLADAIVRGSRWQLAATASTAVGQLAVAFVLARLLTPGEFGLFALALATTEVLGVLGEYGSAAAIARQHPPRRAFVRAALVRTFSRGLLATIAAAGLGFTAAGAFESPSLGITVTALALATIVSNLGLVAQAVAESHLDFRRIAMIDIVAYWTGALIVSIPLAWLGWGAWALVAGFAAQALVKLVAHAANVRQGVSDMAEAQGSEPAEFGARLTAARLLNAGVNQLDKIILGLRATPADVGLYSRSMLLVSQASTAVGTIYDRVLYPVFARVHANAPQSLPDHFLRSIAFIALALTPPALFMSLFAAPTVLLVFGPQWEAAATMLRWGALALPAFAVVRVCDTLARAVGRPGRSVIMKGIYVALLAPLLFVGSARAGVGVAQAALVAALVMSVVQLRDAVRTAGGHSADVQRVLRHVAPLFVMLAATALLASRSSALLAGRGPAVLFAAGLGLTTLGAFAAVGVDARFGSRGLAWVLVPFATRIPTPLRRLIGSAA